MGHVVTLANLKGGVAKTTSTMAIAAAAARDGRRVLVVDADPQQSATAWAASAEDDGGVGFPVVAVRGRAVTSTVKSMAADYDLILVDTPPGEAELPAVTAAMSVADVVLIPTAPTGLDVSRVIRTVQVAAELGRMPAVLITRTDTRWKSHRELLEALGGVDDVALLDAVVRQQVKVAGAFGSPLRDGIDDYSAVWRELHEALGG